MLDLYKRAALIWIRILSKKNPNFNLFTGSAQVHLAEARGFAPRHYSSSLVIALLLLYFSHFYYFFVAITRKEIHLHSKDENGIQPFPASGSPTAGFSLPLKCERRQQVAAYSSSEFPPIKKDTRVGVLYAPFACVPVAEARGFEPLSPWRLHDFQSCPLWPLRYASILRFYFKALPRLLSTAFLFYMFSL